MLENKNENEIIKIVNSFERFSPYEVLQDFFASIAYSISNTVDLQNYKSREASYMKLANEKYKKEEMLKFAHMAALYVIELERECEYSKFHDVFGEIYQNLGTNNKAAGQFFTPQSVSDLMGTIVIDKGLVEAEIAKKGYVSACEPSCGAGATLLGLINALKDLKLNYQKTLYVEAADIDSRCVHMTYIMLSMLGIPARVAHQNTLTMETWSTWYTPMYVLDNWFYRRNRNIERKNEIHFDFGGYDKWTQSKKQGIS